MWASDPRFLLLVSVPPPHKQNLKKTCLDLSSFLGFNFDGRPIKFQIHSCRGNIVKINAKIRSPPAPPFPPPMDTNISATTGRFANLIKFRKTILLIRGEPAESRHCLDQERFGKAKQNYY